MFHCPDRALPALPNATVVFGTDQNQKSWRKNLIKLISRFLVFVLWWWVTTTCLSSLSFVREPELAQSPVDVKAL